MIVSVTYGWKTRDGRENNSSAKWKESRLVRTNGNWSGTNLQEQLIAAYPLERLHQVAAKVDLFALLHALDDLYTTSYIRSWANVEGNQSGSTPREYEQQEPMLCSNKISSLQAHDVTYVAERPETMVVLQQRIECLNRALRVKAVRIVLQKFLHLHR